MKTHLCRLISLFAVVSVLPPLFAEFSDPNFIEEIVYEGNGTVAMAFGPGGRMYAIEKQGRLLLLEPNDQTELSISYQYYEGSWTELPDFDSLSPLATGTLNQFSIEPRQRNDDFAFRYTTVLSVSEAGGYTFYTRSDDGSRLLVNGNEIVSNDGLHGAIEESGTVTLAAGTHTVVVEFFEAGGGEVLEVFWEGPSLEKQPLGGPGSAYAPPHVVADIRADVSTNGERGLLGLALDPDFHLNRHLYLFYSRANDQRLIRLTLDEPFQNALPEHTVQLLSGLPNQTFVHNAGDILFHPNDPHALYVILGDDGNRNVVDDLDTYNGKILRVDPATGLGLPHNPFWNGDASSIRSRVWAHSFRNPFRVAFDPAAPIPDVLYISENGDAIDRLARIEIDADGGWPSNFTTDSHDGKRKVLRTDSPSVTAVAILRGGPFAPDGPVLYQARYGTEIRRWNLVGEDLDTLQALPGDAGQPFLTNPLGALVHFAQGPDGALYYTSTNQGDSLGTGYRIVRIRYQGGEPPSADFTVSGEDTGEVPFTVDFTDTSSYPGASVVTWNWDFGDGTHSTSPNPQHIYSSPGVYRVTLTVTDANGLVDSTTATVTAYVSVPITLSGVISDARNTPTTEVTGSISLHVFQLDGETPAPADGGSGTLSNIFSVEPPHAFSF
ncbi:MAG: PQQ-dependent sugar dehydrogenase, partial [Kiritimatiellae bacterium]|nr:PQQ-dependent sugar dehydrogenase [Kiritimatiellia bacterium]